VVVINFFCINLYRNYIEMLTDPIHERERELYGVDFIKDKKTSPLSGKPCKRVTKNWMKNHPIIQKNLRENIRTSQGVEYIHAMTNEVYFLPLGNERAKTNCVICSEPRKGIRRECETHPGIECNCCEDHRKNCPLK